MAASLDGYAILLRETRRLDEAEKMEVRVEAIRAAHSNGSVAGPDK